MQEEIFVFLTVKTNKYYKTSEKRGKKSKILFFLCQEDKSLLSQ